MEPVKIPVNSIGPWGVPTLVGEAIISNPKKIAITLDSHELLEEFYDLRDQELIMSFSFRYSNKE